MCRCFSIILCDDDKTSILHKKYCHLHNIHHPYYLPTEIWTHIFNYAGLVNLANFRLCDRYFYHCVQRFFLKPYYTTFIDYNGNNEFGNSCEEYKYILGSTFPIYIINDKILPSNIDSASLEETVVTFNLIYTISTYKNFLKTINSISKSNYIEDMMFIRTGDVNIDVIAYCEHKIVYKLCEQILKSLVKPYVGCLRYYLPTQSNIFIDWRICANIISKLVKMVRATHPTFNIYLHETGEFITYDK